MNNSFLEDKEDTISFRIIPSPIFELINLISNKESYLNYYEIFTNQLQEISKKSEDYILKVEEYNNKKYTINYYNLIYDLSNFIYQKNIFKMSNCCYYIIDNLKCLNQFLSLESNIPIDFINNIKNGKKQINIYLNIISLQIAYCYIYIKDNKEEKINQYKNIYDNFDEELYYSYKKKFYVAIIYLCNIRKEIDSKLKNKDFNSFINLLFDSIKTSLNNSNKNIFDKFFEVSYFLQSCFKYILIYRINLNNISIKNFEYIIYNLYKNEQKQIINEDEIKNFIQDIKNNKKYKQNVRNLIGLIDKFLKIKFEISENNQIKQIRLSCIFFYLYKIFSHPYEQKSLMKAIINFIYYSCFLYDFMSFFKDEFNSIPYEIKYVCFYNYMYLASKLVSKSILLAYISCFILEEIIKYFNFTYVENKKKRKSGKNTIEKNKNNKNNKNNCIKTISKVIFNYIAYLYNLQYLFKNFSLFKEFFSFIDTYLSDNYSFFNISFDESWSFLKIVDLNIIPNFKIEKLKNRGKINFNDKEFLLYLFKRIKNSEFDQLELIFLSIDTYINNKCNREYLVNEKNLMKKLNRGISYFLYINNFTFHSTKKGILFNNKNLAFLVSNIECKLFLEPEEYFILKNSSTIFDNTKSFITYINEKTEKSILLFSYIPFEILNAKRYLGNSKYVQKERNSILNDLKLESIESFLYILNYQLKNNKYQKLFKNYNFMSKFFSENMIKLLEIIENFPNLFEENKNIIEYLLRCGEYNLLLAQFILLNCLKSENMKEEQKLILFNYFQFLTEGSKKIYLVYSISLFKFLDHIVISYLEKNINYSSPNNVFSFVLNLKNNTQGKKKSELKYVMPYYYIHKNWTELKNRFYETNLFQQFVEKLNYNNFPKTTVNILNKFISDYRRQYNIRDLIQFEKFPLIKIYYEALAKIEDNGNLLYNYFNDKNLLNKIVKPKSEKILKIEIETTLLCEEYFCYVNKKSWLNLFNYFISDDFELTLYIKKYFLFYKIIEKLYLCFMCLSRDYYMNIENLSSLIDLAIVKCINRTSLNDSGQFFFLLLLKEIKLFIEYLEKGKDKLKEILTERIMNYKYPYLEKYLQIYKFRRIFCIFINEKILEMECIRDICKIYKLNIINNQYINSDIIFKKYLECYRNIFRKLSKSEYKNITYKQFYTCYKYHYLYISNDKENINILLWNIYENLCNENKSIIKLKNEILKLKFDYKIQNNYKNFALSIKNMLNNNESKNNNYSLIADLYLENFLEINKTSFEKINLTKSFFKDVKYYLIDDVIFEFLSIAINICQKTEEEKYLAKYLPEIINIIFKIQISIINSNTFNSISFGKKYEEILNQMKLINCKKLKIILPQLLISYIYENTKLYYLSIFLLSNYANEYIDDIVYILASYLVTEKKDLSILLSKSDNPKRFENNIIKSQTFIKEIVKNLNPRIKNILNDYISFQKYLKEIFLSIKKLDGRNINESDSIKFNIININNLFKNGAKIIVPNLENLKNYKPIVRSENYLKNTSLNISDIDIDMKDLLLDIDINKSQNNEIIVDNSTLYFCEMLHSIKVLSSKERPAKISFRTCKFHENANDIINKYNNKESKYDNEYEDKEHPIFNFLLKGDANDINKELKTFEIFNEINNIFHVKHFDTNYGISLKRYLISPISCHVVLGEWLENSIPLTDIFNFQYGIYDIDQFAGYQKKEKKIANGFILNENEIMNVLYQYIDHKIIDPNIWYEYQKRYIISTAIWSLTCYLTGLGDRHLGNIMYMLNSGDIVHIDFGYVCGKGLSLPIPEIVDFRYTLNIRRNLGLFEENGIFFFYFYKTFSILREYFKTLKSQLDYYAFDPYFDNDHSAYTCLTSLSSTFNKINDSNIKDFLIELIEKCKNPTLLEKMFIGWQPQV